jgi:hypothetical protein
MLQSTIAISTILSDQFNHVCHKAVSISAAPRSTSLRGSALAKDATDTTFGQAQFAAHMINADTATRGA